MKKSHRNSEQTKLRILQSALEEFSTRGFQGARIENIARLAEVNKALIYRYFGDKDQLFQKAIRLKLEAREETRSKKPKDLAEALQYWFIETNQDPTFMRLMCQESLSYNGEEIIEKEYREKYYQRQIGEIKKMQQQEELDSRFLTKYIFLALLALVVLPVTLPQIVKLVTGQSADSKTFIENWKKTLKKIAQKLV